MAYKFNPLTGKFDLTEKTNEFEVTGFIMPSPTKRWLITMDDTGAFISTEIISVNSGEPIGLLLSLTYS